MTTNAVFDDAFPVLCLARDRRVLVWDDVTAAWVPHEAVPVDPPPPPVEPEEC